MTVDAIELRSSLRSSNNLFTVFSLCSVYVHIMCYYFHMSALKVHVENPLSKITYYKNLLSATRRCGLISVFRCFRILRCVSVCQTKHVISAGRKYSISGLSSLTFIITNDKICAYTRFVYCCKTLSVRYHLSIALFRFLKLPILPIPNTCPPY